MKKMMRTLADLIAEHTYSPRKRRGGERSKYRRPHDGMQERHRRRLGGWAQVKRREGLTKRQYMLRQMEF